VTAKGDVLSVAEDGQRIERVPRGPLGNKIFVTVWVVRGHGHAWDGQYAGVDEGGYEWSRCNGRRGGSSRRGQVYEIGGIVYAAVWVPTNGHCRVRLGSIAAAAKELPRVRWCMQQCRGVVMAAI
jgi:hypothetical protein